MTERELVSAAVGANGAASRPAQDELPLISVDDLRVHFRTKRGVVHAVDGVDFDIRDGETLGLVGETGCGKSVTARSFLRLVPMPPGIAAGGRILFRPKQLCGRCDGAGCVACDDRGRLPTRCAACDGVGCEACQHSGRETLDLLTIPDRQMREIRGNRIAMIFQDPAKALNPALTIRQQMAEVFHQHRWADLLDDAGLTEDTDDATGRLLRRAAQQRSRAFERGLRDLPPWRSGWHRIEAALDERIADALADTHISNPKKVMASYPHELSGGMKQRVMIAQALSCDPDLLIADEPTTALDVTIQARILDLIAELQAQHHTAVLYISHDLSLVRGICDRVVVMYAGQVAESSPARELFAGPKHPYADGLLAAIPAPGHRRGELVAIEGNVPELLDAEPSCRFNTRCPHAGPVCRTTEPPLHRHGSPDHLVACFLHEDPERLGVSPEDMPSPGGHAMTTVEVRERVPARTTAPLVGGPGTAQALPHQGGGAPTRHRSGQGGGRRRLRHRSGRDRRDGRRERVREDHARPLHQRARRSHRGRRLLRPHR